MRDTPDAADVLLVVDRPCAYCFLGPDPACDATRREEILAYCEANERYPICAEAGMRGLPYCCALYFAMFMCVEPWMIERTDLYRFMPLDGIPEA
jgi:hypothetical protein